MSRQTALVKSEPQSLAREARRPVVKPACDVYENDEEILVVADVPGVTAEALDIQLQGGELCIAAHRESPEQGPVVVAEYRDCDFQRQFTVPGVIDSNKIDARLSDGVLWLHLPKSEAYKPRQIAVRAG